GGHPLLTVVEADLLALDDRALAVQVEGRGAVISCLGHNLHLRGLFGPPRDLVTRAAARLCAAIRDSRPAIPIRFILLGSVSVNRPGARDPRRGAGEQVLLWTLRALLPPARDNQRAADHLHHAVGTADPHLQWVALRPDTLTEGEVSPYSVHDGLVCSLARPGRTRRANLAHFICELATDDGTWRRWAGRMPVIVDADGPSGPSDIVAGR
ncbi:hypothetical protein FJ250_13665, partial [bacterium]|nr:hypothetical protein [bacterium]